MKNDTQQQGEGARGVEVVEPRGGKNGSCVTNGGRVLGVTALGDSVQDSINTAYRAVDRISWKGVQFRKDIGKKALGRI